MSKAKSTKRALLSSVLALVLCFSMLVGSTFAWFTDTASTGINTIQSGNLDVVLEYLDGTEWKDAEGLTLNFKKAANAPEGEAVLWEPGCTYELPALRVRNNGSLALKYQLIVNGVKGNAKLLEAIDWTVKVGEDDEIALADLADFLTAKGTDKEASEAIVISGHMKEEAGNEYQDLTITGLGITVVATQATVEYDSFGNLYDAAAEHAANTMLDDIADVAAGESATIKLEDNGYVALDSESPIGVKVAGDVTLDLNGKTLFVNAEDVNAHTSLFNIVRGGKLTVTGNGTIEMITGANPLVTAIFNNTSGTLVIENGTYKMDNPASWEVALIPTIIDNNGNAAGATTIINGGNFYHTRNMFRNFPSNNGITELIINGGTFNGKADDWAAIWNQKASANTNEGQSLITVNGGTFNYVEINNEFETGVTIADGVVMPVAVSDQTALNEAIASGETVNVVLATDTTVTVASGAATSKDVTITGDKSSTVVLVNTNPGYEGKLSYQDNANLTFKGITFDASQISGICARGGVVTFVDCHITGELMQTIASKFVFSGCTFDVGVTQVGYGCSDVVFENCSFETDGYGIKIYKEANEKTVNLTVKGCSFKNTGSTARSAILLDHILDSFSYNITVENCTFEGYTETPTATYNKWAARMIVTDSFVKTTDGQHIFSYQTGEEGGIYHKILTSEQLVVTVK